MPARIHPLSPFPFALSSFLPFPVLNSPSAALKKKATVPGTVQRSTDLQYSKELLVLRTVLYTLLRDLRMKYVRTLRTRALPSEKKVAGFGTCANTNKIGVDRRLSQHINPFLILFVSYRYR